MSQPFKYNRDRIQAYLQRWTTFNNPSFPDMSGLLGNNANFAYQCLVIGGYFPFGTPHLDTCRTGFNYTISKIQNLENALIDLSPEVYVKTVPVFDQVQTGDFVVVRTGNRKTVFVVEFDNSVLKYYGKDPLVRGSALPVGDEYIFYLMPDNGSRTI